MCFWTKTRLTNIPVAPESRRVEVETECREVVVRSSTFMFRACADLDRMYCIWMEGALWVVVGVWALALLWVCLYSLVFLMLDVIQQGIYSENVFY